MKTLLLALGITQIIVAITGHIKYTYETNNNIIVNTFEYILVAVGVFMGIILIEIYFKN